MLQSLAGQARLMTVESDIKLETITIEIETKPETECEHEVCFQDNSGAWYCGNCEEEIVWELEEEDDLRNLWDEEEDEELDEEDEEDEVRTLEELQYYAVSFTYPSVEARKNLENPTFHVMSAVKKLEDLRIAHDPLAPTGLYKFAVTHRTRQALIDDLNEVLPPELVVRQVTLDSITAHRVFKK